MFKRLSILFVLSALIVVSQFVSAAMVDGMKKGAPAMKSIGPITFGPDNVLFASDPSEASIFAIVLDDAAASSKTEINVEGIDKKVAALLGTGADNIWIADMAVNPNSNFAYLSVSRGRGPEGDPVLVRVNNKSELSIVSLEDVNHIQVKIPNPADHGEGRRGNPRMSSITDLSYIDGKLYVAGLSNEEFSSNFRVIPFPATEANEGSSIEIFHGAHGKYETNSPIRTFTAYQVNGEPHILAAYTCTPLVKIPLSELNPGTKVKGKTVAELGNRNRPIDMFVYNKQNKDYILMANSSRGVMKITTDDIGTMEGITERVADKDGLPYETIEGWDGVVQLDRLDNQTAVILAETDNGFNLETVPLP